MKNTIYLLAYYYMRPANKRVSTQTKGWMATASNMQYDEQVTVAKKLKTVDLTTAKIILDLGNKKVVRNGWGSENSFDELFGYFLNGYPKYTAEVMSVLDPEYMTRFMTQLSAADSEVVVDELPVVVEANATVSSEA